MQLIETTGTDTRFVALCSELDADLNEQNGEAFQEIYNQYNTLEKIHDVVLALQNDTPVACAAIKEYAPDTAEIKRVFTKPVCRGQGVAAAVISALEQRAKQQGYTRLIWKPGLPCFPPSAYTNVLGFAKYQTTVSMQAYQALTVWKRQFDKRPPPGNTGGGRFVFKGHRNA